MKRLLPILLCLAASPSFAGWNPAGWEVKSEPAPEVSVGVFSVVERGALNLYRDFLGPVNPGKCPSYPTCSAYSREAVRRYGPFAGVVLTASRLLTEGDEMHFSPVIILDRPRIHASPERDMAFLAGEK